MREKDIGTIGELAFATEALKRGYRVSHPIGDNAEYDALVEAGDRVFRVQVKTASVPCEGEQFGFFVRRGTHKTAYSQVDIFACYLVPHQLFFLLPRTAVGSRTNIKLTAAPRQSIWSGYRENWGVFEAEKTPCLEVGYVDQQARQKSSKK